MPISTINQNGLNAPLTLTSPVLTTPNLGTPSAINLANATGLSRSALPTGSVLQVVYGSTTSGASSSTNTYVDTNLTASITPTSATSKILVLVNQNGTSKENTGSVYMALKLRRNSTDILQFAVTDGFSDASRVRWGSTSACYLDSPATTSSTTYKTQFCSLGNAAVVEVQNNGAASTITLMEIAA
jgi:hypothetical protein